MGTSQQKPTISFSPHFFRLDGRGRTGEIRPMSVASLRPPYIVLWISAFLCSLFFVNEWQLVLFASAFLLMLCWSFVLMALDIKGGWNVPRSWTAGFAALFWLLVLFSVFHSDIQTLSIFGFCMFSAMPMTFFLFVMYGDEKSFDRIFKALLFIFAGLGIWAMVQYYALNDMFMGYARHPLANPGALASLLSLALFPGVAWMLHAPSRTQSNVALLFCLILMGGIIATGNRGAFLSLIPAFLVFGIIAPVQVKKHWRCLLLLAIGAAALMLLSETGERERSVFLNRITEPLSADDTDRLSNRSDIWLGVMAMIKDRWMLGTGIGTFLMYYPSYRVPTDEVGAFMAHSDPLQFWAELGILGPVLFYAFGIACVIRTLRALKKLPADSPDRLALVGPFAALIAVIAHAHVTFNFYNFSILFATGLLLAVWYARTEKILGEGRYRLSLPRDLQGALGKVVLAVPFALLAAIFVPLVQGEYYASKARTQALAGDIEGMGSSLNQAHAVSHGMSYKAYLMAIAIPLGILETQGGTLSATEQRQIYEQIDGYVKALLRLNPQSAAAYYYRGRMVQLTPPSIAGKNAPSPEEAFQTSLDMDPMHLGSRLALIRIYQIEKRRDEALALAEEGLLMRYRTLQALELYGAAAEMYLQRDDMENHSRVMQAMAKFQRRYDRGLKLSQKTFAEELFGAGDPLAQ